MKRRPISALAAVVFWTAAGILPAVPLAAAQPETYFSPNGGIRARIVRAIDEAKETADIAVYNFTAFELKDALLRAQRRGVRVRVVCDAREASEGNSMIPVLITSGVPVKQLQKSGQGLMHHKFMVVDKEVLITGSYNWTVSAEKRNQENILVLSDAPAVRAYQNEFDRLWKKK